MNPHWILHVMSFISNCFKKIDFKSLSPWYGIIFSLVLHDSTPYIVRSSICWLGTLLFFYGFYSLMILLLLKCSSDLRYGPCLPARNWGGCVSGFVLKEIDFKPLSPWYGIIFSLTLHDSTPYIVRSSIRWLGTLLFQWFLFFDDTAPA